MRDGHGFNRDLLLAGVAAVALHTGGLLAMHGTSAAGAPALDEPLGMVIVTPVARAAPAVAEREPWRPYPASDPAAPRAVRRPTPAPTNAAVLATMEPAPLTATDAPLLPDPLPASDRVPPASVARDTAAPDPDPPAPVDVRLPAGVASPSQSVSAASPVDDATRPPVLLTTAPPPYPRAARRRGYTGVVELRVHVDEQGRCDEIVVHRSSGRSILDDAAVRAARGWRFEPARRGNRVVARWVEIPVEFDLPDGDR